MSPREPTRNLVVLRMSSLCRPSVEFLIVPTLQRGNAGLDALASGFWISATHQRRDTQNRSGVLVSGPCPLCMNNWGLTPFLISRAQLSRAWPAPTAVAVRVGRSGPCPRICLPLALDRPTLQPVRPRCSRQARMGERSPANTRATTSLGTRVVILVWAGLRGARRAPDTPG